MKFKVLWIAGLMLAGIAGRVQAGAIVGAVGVTSPQGEFGVGFELVNIINQSGLSAGYTSGVTDFGTYTGSTSHLGLTGTGFTGSETRGPQQFTFDLGSVMTIDRIAIWNTSSIGAVSSFRLLSDTDGSFGNGFGAVMLSATALGGSGPAQVFTFAPTAIQYLHFEGLASLTPPDYYGLGEVAFGLSAAEVPEPASMAVWSLGALGMMYARRKRQQKQMAA